jgi:hypothetical protein
VGTRIARSFDKLKEYI